MKSKILCIIMTALMTFSHVTTALAELDECMEHTYGEYIYLKNPTSSEAGLKKRSCIECGHTEYETVYLNDDSCMYTPLLDGENLVILENTQESVDKTLYVAAYRTGRLIEVQQSDMVNETLTFTSAKSGDELKVFIFDKNMNALSYPVSGTLGDNLVVNIISDINGGDDEEENGVTLLTDLYEEGSYSGTSVIFDSITYNLDNAEVFVNGVEYPDADEAFENFVEGNNIGTVTLIDNSEDGKYDVINIDYQEWAVVDSVLVGSSVSKILFDDYQVGNGMVATLIIDHEDAYKTYKFIKDGVEVGLDAIKADDIVLVTYDVTDKLNDSPFIRLEISDTVVEGIVTSRSMDDRGMAVYNVNGEEYSYVGDVRNHYSLEVGNNYRFYLDAKGRIVYYYEIEVPKNYGIIDRVWRDNNDDNRVRLILPDGTRCAYILKNGEEDIAAEIAYGYSDMDSSELQNLEDRIVSYKLNSKNEVYGIELVSVISVTGSYSADNMKIGTAKMNESTQIFNLTAKVNWNDPGDYSSSDLAAGSFNNFQNGEEYTILYGDRNSDGYSRVVVITDGFDSISVRADIAIVDSVNTGMVGDTERYEFDLLTPDSNGEIVSIYIDQDEFIYPEDFSRGDVIVYLLTANNEMQKITKLFSVKSNDTDKDDAISYEEAIDFLSSVNAIDDPGMMYGDDWFFESGIPAWDESERTSYNGYARIGFGAIVDRTFYSVTIAKPEVALVDSDYADAGEIVSCGENIQEMELASDVNVYVYDFNERDRAGYRISAGVIGNIVKTPIPGSQISEDENGDYVYNWSRISSVDHANYAFFKTVDGLITDILVIIPAE